MAVTPIRPDASPSGLDRPGAAHPEIDETPTQDDLLDRVIKDKETRPEPTIIEVYHLGRLLDTRATAQDACNVPIGAPILARTAPIDHLGRVVIPPLTSDSQMGKNSRSFRNEH